MIDAARRIYISGMHSGQNPCSGVGIARCLRKAYPAVSLVGVDHWQGSSGLHDSALDDVLLLPQWNQMDDERHSQYLKSILDDGNLWISSMDMEVHWIGENVGRHDNLLAPSISAVEATEKPGVRAMQAWDFHVPEYIPASLPDSEIHTFLRHSSWQCWLKSPYHDARRISSWAAFERIRDTMSRSWRTSKLFLQRHVNGDEETVAFAAYQGELLAAVKMEKRQITPEGKTWAARVTPVEPEFFERLSEIMRRLEWSGGGEIEYARDADGKKWIIECNPRFPAWIYGGALAGHNLPAKLISRVWDFPFLETVSRFPFFTRVVQEIPAKEEVGLPLPPDPTSRVWGVDEKKGKGGAEVASHMPVLDSSLDDEDEDSLSNLIEPEKIPPSYLKEVSGISASYEGESPERIHLENWTQARFDALSERLRSLKRGPEVRIGYSVKTSPTDDFLRKARKAGYYAECISQMEVHRALDFGFQPNEVILNGPGKFWPMSKPPVTSLHMLFCDSIEEFDRALEIPNIAQCVGFRMRIPKLHSRFGNSLSEFDNFRRIVKSVKKLKGSTSLGFHFHMPSWAIGVGRWTEALSSLFLWCVTIQELTGKPVKRLDMGGGFFPKDLENLDFSSVRECIPAELSDVEAIYFEPGRSMTQDGEILVSRVLDVRKDHDGGLVEIVVDASIAELPLAQAFNHKIFYQSRQNEVSCGSCEPLRKGPTRILGRICMEDDILSHGAELPEDIKIGDLIIFGDAGGYERSMSYVFGRG